MKQVNFNNPGGFPLEQETLERLQTAYRSELYEALKKHLSIELGTNYIIAPASENSKGWAIIHQYELDNSGEITLQGILYPIEKATPTLFLKTTREATNLIYGDGTSQTAYYDYYAEYVDAKGTPYTDDIETVLYYDVAGFQTVKDLKAIETILDSIDAEITAIKTNIDVVEGNINSIETNIVAIENDIKENYLPLNGSKAMEGNLRLGSHQLYLNPNLNLGTSNDFLALDSSNQVVKNNTIIAELIERITTLESKPASAVPIGMIAIWGKPAPFPEGWEEYVPLRGRMPVGFDNNQSEFNNWSIPEGGDKNTTLTKENIPPLDLTLLISEAENSGGDSRYVNATDIEYAGEKKYSNVVNKGINPVAVNILSPYRVVHFIVYTGEPSDTIKPTSPTNLTLLNVSNTTAAYSWTASSDNVGVYKYVIYKNGQPLEEVSGNVLSYTANNLSPATEYEFTVAAKDAAGNVSLPSQPLIITTTNVSPLIPANFNGYSQGANQLYLFWDIPADPGIISYDIWRRVFGGTSYSINTTTRNQPNYTDIGAFDTIYFYKVRSLHISGNYSDFTDELTLQTDPGNPECFDVESLVTMASGQSKKLKNIVVGDKLHGLTFPNEIDESEGDYMLWNGKLSEATKAEVTVVNKRTSVQPNYFEIKTADNTIKVTGEHPLLVTEDGENLRWVSTKNILESMFLIDKTGKTKAIESITFKEEPLEVALLDVEDVDNYIISGIAAHNNKPLDPVDPNLPQIN